MFEVGRTIVVDLARFGLPDVASAPFGPPDIAPLLEDVVESVSELFAKPEQEHRLVAAENRELKLP